MNIIKLTRKQHGVTQEDMAKILGVERRTVINYEKKEDKDIPNNVLDTLVEHFGIELPSGVSYSYEVIKTKEKSKEEIRISIPQKNINKFKETFLYVLEKIGAKHNVGQVVLYKILYFIDFDYYELYEEQLIGATYIKNHFGPTPVDFKKITDDMISNKELVRGMEKYFGRDQKKYLPKRSPNLDCLSAKELDHINKVIEKYGDKSARDLSDYSHKDVPWIATKEGDIIDYESVFYRTPETSVRSYD